MQRYICTDTHIFPIAHKDCACTYMKDMASTYSPTGTEVETNEGGCPMGSETNTAVPSDPTCLKTPHKGSAFQWMRQNCPHSAHITRTNTEVKAAEAAAWHCLNFRCLSPLRCWTRRSWHGSGPCLWPLPAP